MFKYENIKRIFQRDMQKKVYRNIRSVESKHQNKLLTLSLRVQYIIKAGNILKNLYTVSKWKSMNESIGNEKDVNKINLYDKQT